MIVMSPLPPADTVEPGDDDSLLDVVDGLCSCGRGDLRDFHEWQPGCDDPFPDDGVLSLDVMQSIPGITYRRLDYWVRVGLLEPGNPVPGTGYPRIWTGRDYRLARLILALTEAGLSLHTAADAAVAYVDKGEDTLTIGKVRLRWSVAGM